MLKKQRYMYTTFGFQCDNMIYQSITVFKESEIVFEMQKGAERSWDLYKHILFNFIYVQRSVISLLQDGFSIRNKCWHLMCYMIMQSTCSINA